jgi:hypothetical protein
MYLAKCTSCHRAYEPSKYSAKAWADSIDEMEAKKRVRLTQEEKAEILGYLTGDLAGKP